MEILVIHPAAGRHGWHLLSLFDVGGQDRRGGADVFKALALGAKAVCLGRPYVYGLVLAGQAGAQEVIRNIKADFELTMGLAGCASIAEIGPHSLIREAEGVEAAAVK